MFLALRELKKEKKRFLLIVSVIVLIAYLVFFLTSLAFGLARLNRTAVDHLNANAIVVTKSSDANIYASNIEPNQAIDLGYTEHDFLNVINANVYVDQGDDAMSLVFMGGDFQRIMPPLIEGTEPMAPFDIAISHSITKDADIKIGSQVALADSGRIYTVVGITEDANFNTVPVAYAMRTSITPAMMMYQSDTDAQSEATPMMPDRISALLSSDTSPNVSSALSAYTKTEFIDKLPGYQAQVLTFGLMIISLSLIAAIILGIFMYILTIQKKSIFAILKIQGYRSGYIVTSILYQVVILVISGLAIGLGLTLLTIQFLPSAVPIAINWELFWIVSGFIALASLCGALFSSYSVLKIDPLEAL